jgi:hypothetical protein
MRPMIMRSFWSGKEVLTQSHRANLIAFLLIVAGPAFAATSEAVQAQIATPTQTTPQAPHFTASPTSGQAPLTVTFCASAGIGLDFGDGTGGGMGLAQSGDCPGDSPAMVKHTYARAGTYRLSGFPCPSSARAEICREEARQAATVTITITSAR